MKTHNPIFIFFGSSGFRCRSRVGRVKRAPPKADRNRIGRARCALPTLQLFAFRTWNRKSLFFLALFAATAHAGPADEVLLPVADDPAVSYRITFFAGSQYDPPGKEGLAALTARMISEGSTKQHRYKEILDLLFPMAGGYDSSCSVETVVISGRIHKDNVSAFQPLLLQAIVEPAFRSEDLERIRSDMISYLENTLRYAGDEDLGKAVLYESMFAGTAYGHIPDGRVKSLKSITLDDVRAFYRRNFANLNYVLGLGGGYDTETLNSLKEGLKKLPPYQIFAKPHLATKPINGLRVTIVEKDAPATAISIGARLNVLRGQPDWYPLALANSWFGEHRNSASHLYQVLREVRGLNYGDYSYIEHFPNGGALEFPVPNNPRRQQIFEMWIRPVPHAWGHFALRAALRELKNLVDNGLTEEQVLEKRAALGKYVFHFAPTTTKTSSVCAMSTAGSTSAWPSSGRVRNSLTLPIRMPDGKTPLLMPAV